MDFRELVVTRRTVHNYHTDSVPESLVEESLKLSLWAPNHRLTFPWVYTWVGRTARAQLAELAVELKAQRGEVSAAKQQALRDNVLNPAHLIALGIKRSPDEDRMHEDYATLACSVQIMALHLWQHGVATKWSTGGWGVHDKTYSVLALDRSAVQLEGMLMVGRALNMPAAPERPLLGQFLRRVE